MNNITDEIYDNIRGYFAEGFDFADAKDVKDMIKESITSLEDKIGLLEIIESGQNVLIATIEGQVKEIEKLEKLNADCQWPSCCE